jgi:hypothetical protein
MNGWESEVPQILYIEPGKVVLNPKYKPAPPLQKRLEYAMKSRMKLKSIFRNWL